MATTERMGPCGGPGGSPWSLEGIGRLIQITIWHRDVIDAIQFHYFDSEGKLKHSDVFGKRRTGRGCKESEISLDDGENLSTIAGTLKRHNRKNAVKSLLITTDRGTQKQIGAKEGMDFSLPTIGGTVVGFHGNEGKYLYAIGLHLKSPGKATGVKKEPDGQATGVKKELGGPPGGPGGKS